MFRIPEIDVDKNCKTGEILSHLRHLADIPETEKFCCMRMSTFARPPAGIEDTPLGADIPGLCKATSAAALERAAAIINEEAARLGWRFHAPTRWADGSLGRLVPVHTETLAAYEELWRIVDEDSSAENHMMHDVGAKGRRRLYLSWAFRPMTFVLGTRLDPPESGLVFIPLSNAS